MRLIVNIDKWVLIIAVAAVVFALFLYLEANNTLYAAIEWHQAACELPAWLN